MTFEGAGPAHQLCQMRRRKEKEKQGVQNPDLSRKSGKTFSSRDSTVEENSQNVSGLKKNPFQITSD